MTMNDTTRRAQSPAIPKEKSVVWETLRGMSIGALNSIWIAAVSFAVANYREQKRNGRELFSNRDGKGKAIYKWTEGILAAALGLWGGAHYYRHTKRHNEEVKAIRQHVAEQAQHASKYNDPASADDKLDSPTTDNWRERTGAVAPDVANRVTNPL